MANTAVPDTPMSDEPLDPENGRVQKDPATFRDIFRSFVVLGWSAFGGPAAHIGVFQKVFVEAKNWMSLTVFNELLSLGQVSFAIGVTQQGILGGLLSGLLFQYPGLLLMSLTGAGAAEALANPARWLQGLTAGLAAAGVALILSAAIGLARGQCKDEVTRLLCLMSATVAFYYTSNFIFPLLIVVGGLTTLYTKRNDDVALKDTTEKIHKLGVPKLFGAILILTWITIWVVVASIKNTTEYSDGRSTKVLHWFEAFYRTGSIIFGGGQVVLPLLLDDVVQYDRVCTTSGGTLVYDVTDASVCDSYTSVESEDSWITADQFFAGLGVVQAMPGPLFNLSAYIGAVAARRAHVNVLAGIFAAWFGLFGPGVLLIYGVLPFWGGFRKQPVYRRMLPGLNSSAVGLVVAAVFTMGFKIREISPFPNASVCIAFLAFYATHFMKKDAPLVVLASGVLGIIAWATGCS